MNMKKLFTCFWFLAIFALFYTDLRAQCVIWTENFDNLTTASPGGWQITQTGDACHAKWYISDREPGRPANTPCADFVRCGDKTLHVGQNDNFLCQELSGPDAGCGDCGAWQIESSVGCPQLNYSTQANALSPVIPFTSGLDSLLLEFDYLAGLRGLCNTPTGDYAQGFYRVSTDNGATWLNWNNFLIGGSECLPKTSSCRLGTSEDGVMTYARLVIKNLPSGANAIQLRYYWNSYDDCNGTKLLTLAVDNIKLTAYRGATVNNVRAGTDQFLVCSSSAQLNALNPAPQTGSWEVISGQNVTFANRNSPTTTISGLAPRQSYVFQWTVGEACDVVKITTGSGNVEQANAGPDQTINVNNTTLSGNAGGGIRGWSLIRQPAGSAASITNPGSASATVIGMDLPGVYLFQWYIQQGCCASSDTVAITVSFCDIIANAGPDASVCANEYQLNASPVRPNETGLWTIVSQPNAVVFPVNLEDSNNASTRISNLVTGEYRFRWIVRNTDCEATDDITIRVSTDLDLNLATQDPGCGPSGRITVSAQNGLAPYRYTLLQNFQTVDFSQQTPAVFFGLNAGVYTVVLEDGAGCNIERPVILTDGANTLAMRVVAKTDPTCAPPIPVDGPAVPFQDGRITVEVNGGAPPYAYELIPAIGINNNDGTFTGLEAGLYEVKVTDQGGCSRVVEVALSPRENIHFDDFSWTDPVCTAQNGRILISASSNAGPVRYDITPNVGVNQGNGIFSALPVGTYLVILNSPGGCRTAAFLTLNLDPGDLNVNLQSVFNPSCGLNNGEIRLTASSSGGGLVYAITPNVGQNLNNGRFTNLPPGNYTVRVADINGCAATRNVSLVSSPPVRLNLLSKVDPTCATEGEIRTLATGGGGALLYTISPLQGVNNNTGLFTGLSGGNYKIKATDFSGCADSLNVFLAAADRPEIVLDATKLIYPTCNSANGRIKVDVNNAALPIEYNISPAAGRNFDNGLFLGLRADDYTISIKDANGCIASLYVPMSGDQTLIARIDSVKQPTCGNSGKIFIRARSVFSGIEYSIFPNVGLHQGNGVFTDLPPGIYSIRVADQGDCVQNFTVDLRRRDSDLDFNFIRLDNPICTAINGRIGVEGRSYAGVIHYTLTPNVGNQITPVTFDRLPSGNYIVTATDADGCTLSKAARLAVVRSDIDLQEFDLSYPCQGNKNGQIRVIANGTALTYRVNGGAFQNNPVLANLGEGKYIVEIRDEFGCADTDSTALFSRPNPLNIEELLIDYPCAGNANGKITALAKADGQNLLYSLNSGEYQSSPVFDNLAPGAYQITVREPSGCLDSETTLLIDRSPNLNINEVLITRPTCAQDGKLEIKATTDAAGELAYSLDGINFQAANIFTNLSPGRFTVWARDITGCTDKETVLLPASSLSSLKIDEVLLSYPFCTGSRDGRLEVKVTGGAGAVFYSIDGANYQEVPVFMGLNEGEYTVYVKDATGCSDVEAVKLLPANPTTLTITNVVIQRPFCNGSRDGEIVINAQGGVGAITYALNSAAFRVGNRFSGLEEGSYTVWVRDSRGCTRSREVVLVANTQNNVALNELKITQPGCAGVANGSIVASVAGGAPPYIYTLNGLPATLQNEIRNLGEGEYTLQVRDRNGCLAIRSFSLAADRSNKVDIEELKLQYPLCQIKGSIQVLAVSNSGGLRYALNAGGFTSDNLFTGLAAGVYTIRVEDSKGCQDQETVNLFALPPTTRIDEIVITPPACLESQTGKLEVKAITSAGPLRYAINGGSYQTDNQFTALLAGEYEVEARDTNGCISTEWARIRETNPALAIASIETTRPKCVNVAEGTLTVFIAEQQPDILYSIDGVRFQNSPTFSALKAGPYTVWVKNRENCTARQVVTLAAQNPAIEIEDIIVTPTTCWDSFDGQLRVVARGGTGAFSYSLDDNDFQSSSLFSGLSYGKYNVFVRDAAGCEAIAPRWMISPQRVELSISVQPASGESIADGSINVNAIGGTPPFTYSLNNGPFRASGTFIGLRPGVYTLQARDSRECITEQSVSVGGRSGSKIGESNGREQVVAYPNPNNGAFVLQLQTVQKQEAQVSLYDLKGKLIDKQSLQVNEGITEYSYRLENTGIYLLEVLFNNGTKQSIKIVSY
jgi:hypothetical protein